MPSSASADVAACKAKVIAPLDCEPVYENGQLANVPAAFMCRAEKAYADVTKTIYCETYGTNEWRSTCALVAMLVLCVFIITIITGMRPASQGEIFKILMLVLFSYAFATNLDLFMGTVYPILMGAPNYVIEIMTGGTGLLEMFNEFGANVTTYLRSIWYSAEGNIEDSHLSKTSVIATTAGGVVLILIIAVLGGLVLGSVILQVFVSYYVSRTILVLLFLIVPIFIILYQNSYTRGFSNACFSYCYSITVQQIVHVILIAVVFSASFGSGGIFIKALDDVGQVTQKGEYENVACLNESINPRDYKEHLLRTDLTPEARQFWEDVKTAYETGAVPDNGFNTFFQCTRPKGNWLGDMVSMLFVFIIGLYIIGKLFHGAGNITEAITSAGNDPRMRIAAGFTGSGSKPDIQEEGEDLAEKDGIYDAGLGANPLKGFGIYANKGKKPQRKWWGRNRLTNLIFTPFDMRANMENPTDIKGAWDYVVGREKLRRAENTQLKKQKDAEEARKKKEAEAKKKK